MGKKWNLSKSQYCRGYRCVKSLWLYRHRKDLLEVADTGAIAAGYEVEDAASDRYPQGKMVTAEFYEIDLGVKQTEDFIAGGARVIFEATAKTPDGHFSRIDILKKVRGKDEWDLIEVKGSTEVKEYHEIDVSFQRYVFEQAGYKIRKSILMHINRDYVRKGELDLKKLFKEVDLTELALEKREDVIEHIDILCKVLNKRKEPDVDIGGHCSSPFGCEFSDYCHQHLPDFSVYNIFNSNSRKLEQCIEEGIVDVCDIPDDFELTFIQGATVEAHKRGIVSVQPEILKSFISELRYPLYYLDYESIFPAIPMYDNSSPYRQICFQFSLHIQEKKGGEVSHQEFVYEGEGDPRLEFTKALVKACGKSGSVIVYNRTFEQGRNRELAELFPQYEKQLLAINDRVVDLLDPFGKRWLYHPDMMGSASIKSVLPAFVPELSYKDLEIQNGGDASELYKQIACGEISGDDAKVVIENLKAYCHLDTLAMVELMRVVYQYALKS